MMFNKILRLLSVLSFRYVFRYRFKSFGKKVNLYCPLKINGIHNIIIEDSVDIEYRTWLAAVPIQDSNACILKIGSGSIIGHFNHIYATKSVVIGKKVLTADKVYISDNLHGYENIEIPIMDQPVKQIGTVFIGDGTWLGENVCVIGANIGRNCTIGANSVVTKDIPDYSVAVGAPAKVIKSYCQKSKKWIKVA